MKSLRFSIVPRAPFRLDATVWVLRRRAENALDPWDGRTYRRVVLLGGSPAELVAVDTGSMDRPRLDIAVFGDRLSANAERLATAAIDRMLGLSCDLDGFYRLAANDATLRPIARKFRGLKPVAYPSLFEALVNGIACQQVTLTFGIQLLNRLIEACGHPIEVNDTSARAFPQPHDLLSLGSQSIRNLQFSGVKTRALLEVSQAIIDRKIAFETIERLDDAAAIAHLCALRGVGRWTAEYVLLRGLRRIHVFPCDDVGARNNLGRLLGSTKKLTYEAARLTVDRWYPFAGLVYFHLLMDRLASLDPALMQPNGGIAIAHDRGSATHDLNRES
jgi:DNA-3-methyladenine glycosylase II